MYISTIVHLAARKRNRDFRDVKGRDGRDFEGIRRDHHDAILRQLGRRDGGGGSARG